MKKLVFGNNYNTIHVDNVNLDKPVFAEKNDELCGMLVLESEGWTIKKGRDSSVNGYHKTAKRCLLDARRYGYTFTINDRYIR